MNAEKLYLKKFKELGEWEYKDSGAFYCGQCRLIYPNLEMANKCCQNHTCKCGKVCEKKYYVTCDECLKKQGIEKEKEKFNKAEKLDIKDYDGYLLSDEYASDDFAGYFDNYFENECDFACPTCGGETTPVTNGKDSVLSNLICKNSECSWVSPSYEIIDDIYDLFAPEYIWATRFEPLELDLPNILENATEEHHETVYDHIKGKEELKKAIDIFNEKNKNNGTYWESKNLALVNIKEFAKELYSK